MRAALLPVLFGSRTFLPQNVATVLKWLDPTRGLYQDAAGTTPAPSDTNSVGLWQDQSGNGKHASQTQVSAPDKRPILKLGIAPLPMIRFDGVDDFLTSVLSGLAQPFTVFMVVKNLNLAPAADQNFYRGSSGAVFYTNHGDSDKLTMFGGSVLGSSAPSSGAHVYTQIWNGASSAAYGDGTLLFSGNAGASGIVGALNIGAGTSGGSNTAVDLGDFIVCSGALASDPRQQIESWLKPRWGVL